MLTSTLKSYKISSNLDNLYINDWKEKRGKIGIDTLYLISHNFQRLLINPKNKANIITQVFAFQLAFKIHKTNIKTQTIDDITLETNTIVVFTFFVWEKDGRLRFFEKSFLLANIKPDIIFGMSFLSINNTNVDF